MCGHCLINHPNVYRKNIPVINTPKPTGDGIKKIQTPNKQENNEFILQFCNSKWWESRSPMPYEYHENGNKKELFIHWYYINRTEDVLNPIEIFHTNVLYKYNVMERFDTINFNIAVDGEEKMTDSMKEVVDLLNSGHATVKYKIIKNSKDNWENETCKEFLKTALGNKEKEVYYTHFKGVSRMSQIFEGKRSIADILYWCWLMYDSIFSDEATKNLEDGKAACGIVRKTQALDKIGYNLFVENDYHKVLEDDKFFLHNCGSFMAVNSKYFDKYGKRQEVKKNILKLMTTVDQKYAVESFLLSFVDSNDVYHEEDIDDSINAYLLFTNRIFEDKWKQFKMFSFPVVLENDNKYTIV